MRRLRATSVGLTMAGRHFCKLRGCLEHEQPKDFVKMDQFHTENMNASKNGRFLVKRVLKVSKMFQNPVLFVFRVAFVWMFDQGIYFF